MKKLLLGLMTINALVASDVVMSIYPPMMIDEESSYYENVDSSESTPYMEYKKSKFKFLTSIGVQKGTAKEIVYNDDSTTLSELTWETNSLYIANFGLTYRATDWLGVNFSFGTKFLDGSATMDDFDWANGATSPWSDWSHHDDTKVTDLTKFDLNIDLRLFNGENVKIFGILGYKIDNQKFIASGGAYSYDDGNDTGVFGDGVQVISYEQNFKTPYAGVKIDTQYNNFTCKAQVIGSNMVETTAHDTHFLRGLQYEENYKGGKMMNMYITLGYILNQFSFNLGYEVNKYYLNKGDVRTTDLSTGEATFSSKSVGLSNESYSYTLGASYLF